MRADPTQHAIDTLKINEDRRLGTAGSVLQTLGIVLAVALPGAVVSNGGVELEAVGHSLTISIRAETEVRVIAKALYATACNDQRMSLCERRTMLE